MADNDMLNNDRIQWMYICRQLVSEMCCIKLRSHSTFFISRAVLRLRGPSGQLVFGVEWRVPNGAIVICSVDDGSVCGIWCYNYDALWIDVGVSGVRLLLQNGMDYCHDSAVGIDVGTHLLPIHCGSRWS